MNAICLFQLARHVPIVSHGNSICGSPLLYTIRQNWSGLGGTRIAILLANSNRDTKTQKLGNIKNHDWFGIAPGPVSLYYVFSMGFGHVLDILSIPYHVNMLRIRHFILYYLGMNCVRNRCRIPRHAVSKDGPCRIQIHVSS